MSDAAAVSIRGLTKRYGRTRAVSELTLDAQRGEILGFLGLNGAGKTTTIRILLDLLRPTAGTASVFGRDCQKDGLAVRSQIGYLPGEMGISAHLTGREALALFASLNGRRPDPRRRTDLQERFALPDGDLKRRLREFSMGMKRKLGLVQAFESDPPLLILDEPTEGLDPLMQGAFYELLAETKKRGGTVFMSSHVLSEVDRVCDRVALLRKGRLVLNATVGELRTVASRRVEVRFSEETGAPDGLPGGVELTTAAPRSWTLKVAGPLGPLLDRLSGLPVYDIDIAEPSLEDVVMRYYREGE
jgi:ABC-2 type transport system ATP-binding protein